MYRFALVEDDLRQKEDFLSKIEEFFASRNEKDYEVIHFPDGESFLQSYSKGSFTAIFLDIEMPGASGVEVAKKLREFDARVPLVFITIMAQFALTGYEVDAIDYLLKPVTRTRFFAMMEKLLRRHEKDKPRTIEVSAQHETKLINVDDIYYIEISGHMISIFTDIEIIAWGTLSGLLKELPSDLFVRCNNSIIVNISKIVGVKGNEANLGKYKVAISRSRKNETLNALATYQKYR
ncbi:MAG: response regulator transcription factor [Bacilli bacterium]|nr:response regulator transcription factor [Bacilli bacterium]